MRPAPRADPWEPGRAPIQAPLAPVMRSRGPAGPQFRSSTFQYHPRHLLFSREGAWHELHPQQPGDCHRIPRTERATTRVVEYHPTQNARRARESS
eukprot:9319678-Alexandrium_andersonii.AAC.1